MGKGNLLLKKILDDSEQMIHVIDSENFHMLYANESTKKNAVAKGRPYEGVACYQYLFGLNEQCLNCPLKTKGDLDGYEAKMETEDHTYLVDTKVAKWNDKQIFIEYVNDITEIRHAEKIYETQIQRLISSIPNAEGIFKLDLTEDKVLEISGIASGVVEETLGKNVDMLVRNISNYVPYLEGKQAVYEYFCHEALLRAYEEGKVEISKETEFYFSDKHVRIAKISARLLVNPKTDHLECIIFGRDITQEKMEKETQFHLVSALSRDYLNVFLIDSEKEVISIIKLEGYITKGLDKNGKAIYPYYPMCQTYIRDRVHPDDQPMMLEVMKVKNLLKELKTKDEYSGKYKVLDKGETHYYQYKYIRIEDSNSIIAGFQNVDAVVLQEMEYRKKLEENIRAIEGLASQYDVLHFLDLETDEYSSYYIGDGMSEGTKKIDQSAKDYFDAHRKSAAYYCHPDFIEEIMSYADKDVIRAVLHTKKRHEVNYLSLNKQGEYVWTSLVLIKIGDVNKEAKKIAIGYYLVDAQMKEKLAREEMLEEQRRQLQEKNIELKKSNEERDKQLEILTSLSGIYLSMHLIDLEKNEEIEYASTDQIRKYVNKNTNADRQMVEVMKGLIKDEYVNSALAFTDLKTLQKRMKGKKTIFSDFLGASLGWIRAAFITITAYEDGTPKSVFFTTQVVDEEKRKEESLILKSNTDELTRFLNRRAFEEDMKAYKAQGIPEDFALISMDINGLKVVNDTFGHGAGDELIVGGASCIKRCFGRYGKVYRMGGDEFMAVLTVDEEKAAMLVEDFEGVTMEWSGELVKDLSVSYGYVTKKEFPTSSLEEMAKVADIRMYETKKCTICLRKSIDEGNKRLIAQYMLHVLKYLK